MKRRILLILGLFLVLSCTGVRRGPASGMEYASWFSLQGDTLEVISPFDGAVERHVVHPCKSLVCFSSSYIGYLQFLGADSLVTGVSGLSFVSDSLVLNLAVDVGYDSAPDYERIVGLKPDYVLMYSISSGGAPSLAKLQDLGIEVITLHEHLEPHPLGRAEYLKLFGALSGRRALADSLFGCVRDSYLSLVTPLGKVAKKVLVNIPYGDQWYVPASGNYFTRLVRDAGGELLGSASGSVSGVISVEKAYELSRQADVWLNPGWCSSLSDLRSVHPLFSDFPVIGKSVWNNTALSNPSGGNAFWETGSARPDLLLSDLRTIFSDQACPSGENGESREFGPDTLNYFIRLR